MNTSREADALRVMWNRILLDDKMQMPEAVRFRINALFEEAIGEPTPDRQPSDAAVEAAQKAWTAAYWKAEPSRQDWMRAALEAAYRVDVPRPLLDRAAVHAAIADELDGEGVVSYGLAPKLTGRVMDLLNGAES